MNIAPKTLALLALAATVLLLVGGGMNLDAGKVATAVCSFIAAATCMGFGILVLGLR